MSKRTWTTRGLWHLTFTMVLLAIVLAANGLADEWQAPQRAVRKKNPLACDPQELAVGREMYLQNCAPCHGETGRGNGVASPNLEPKPKDFTATPVTKQTDGALFWKIGEGHRPMPGFNQTISEDGRWHIVCYIRTFAPAATQPTTQH